LYDHTISVSLTQAQKQAIREAGAAEGVGIGTMLREKTLATIGRQDLSMQDEVGREIGRHAEREAQPFTETDYSAKALMKVTKAQLRAIKEAADAGHMKTSALCREATLVAIGQSALSIAPDFVSLIRAAKRIA